MLLSLREKKHEVFLPLSKVPLMPAVCTKCIRLKDTIISAQFLIFDFRASRLCRKLSEEITVDGSVSSWISGFRPVFCKLSSCNLFCLLSLTLFFWVVFVSFFSFIIGPVSFVLFTFLSLILNHNYIRYNFIVFHFIKCDFICMCVIYSEALCRR